MRPTLAPARCILPQLADVTSSTDGTEIEITRTTPSYASEQRSAELRLSGESGWGRWLVGAYWFDEDKYGALGLVRSGFTPPAVLPTTFMGRVYFLSANTTVMSQVSYTLVEVTYRFGN
jgi:hypothetical protein